MNRETIIKKMRDIDLIDFRDEDEDEHVAEAVRLVDYHIKITRSKLEGAEYKLRVATRGSAK